MTKKKPARPPSDRETRVFPPTEAATIAADLIAGPKRDPFEGLDEPMKLVPDLQAPDPRPTLPSPTVPMDGAAKGIRWEVGALWTDRIERMADARGLSVEGFLESLLRRAWVSTPPGLRKGE